MQRIAVYKLINNYVTTKWSEVFEMKNPVLPQLSDVIKSSLKDLELSQDRIDFLCRDVGKLVIETVPELVYVDASDSFLYETGFEDCTKYMHLNLEKIGIKNITK